MQKGTFEAKKNAAAKLVEKFGLLDERNYFPDYSKESPGVLRALKYRERWERCVAERWFDLKLIDQSLIQFKREPSLSYSFLDSPLAAPTFDDFAKEQYGDGWEVIAHEARSEYELFLSSSVQERSATPVRYDFSELQYREGVHPASHLHVGIDSEIRVCAAKIMTPISFVLFVMRQFYPHRWENFLKTEAKSTIFREVRETLTSVSGLHLKGMDFLEVHLT